MVCILEKKKSLPNSVDSVCQNIVLEDSASDVYSLSFRGLYSRSSSYGNS